MWILFFMVKSVNIGIRFLFVNAVTYFYVINNDLSHLWENAN